MKPENFGKLKYLIIKEIEETRNLEELEGRLDIIKKTLHHMKRPERNKVPTTKKELLH
jgi:hypothetical protein